MVDFLGTNTMVFFLKQVRITDRPSDLLKMSVDTPASCSAHDLGHCHGCREGEANLNRKKSCETARALVPFLIHGAKTDFFKHNIRLLIKIKPAD